VSLSWEVAAGVPEAWTTALQAMYLVADFAPGKSILWHAGASSVSIAGIQLSKAHGASAVYATVGSREKVDFVTEDLGADGAWNYNEVDWAEKVMEATKGQGVDIIVDFVGQSYFQRNLESVAVDGQVVMMGLLSGSVVPAGLDISAFVRKRVRVQGSRLRSRAIEYQEKLRDMLVEQVLPGLVGGSLNVPIERVFDWRDVQQAHALMESNAIKGKIVCRVL
jgi:NADPH:quinone reductase-like Zn-dependent oxidoreductase